MAKATKKAAPKKAAAPKKKPAVKKKPAESKELGTIIGDPETGAIPCAANE